MVARVAVLCGGVGAARYLLGLVQVVEPDSIVGIVNTADDMRLHGLAISPDLDTCTYTLAGEINPDTGWGLRGESWQARDTLERYGGQTWFSLGDRDLGTHLYRTQRLDEGAPLSTVTAEITSAWGLELDLIPMTDQPVRTKVTIEGGETLDFQRYFVERRHADPVRAVTFDGASDATPAPGVVEALRDADRVVIAPSNPFVSIGPILAIPGIHDVLAERRDSTVAISPIVGGAAIKGPAADMLEAMGHDVSAVGVAGVLGEVAAHLVIDTVDASLVPDIEARGVRAHVTDTMMRSPEIARDLATITLTCGS